ncbi:MAG: 16S rRNA (guanine(966)-N(2))-methyltransferase RsmD [Deltaproteobacteria bacterium]|nr:16S rRNA (guanine(966)-N(2))-methyltransferase RsmD [Deltaproteobacteria bacterium]
MRIVAGEWRGRALFAPRGSAVRPTADRVREAIFDLLGDRVVGAAVLDLFAGTGALGLEALSRGAQGAVFVESAPAVFAALRRNIKTLGARGAETLPMDYRLAIRRLRAAGARFGLVFLDPPYGKGIAVAAAADVARAGLAAPGATVVVEDAARAAAGNFPAGWAVALERRYGDTRVVLLEVPAGPPAGKGPAKEDG